MFKLKIQLCLGELANDDPTARDLSNQFIEVVRKMTEQIAIEKALVVDIEKVSCVNEQRKDGRNILAV